MKTEHVNAKSLDNQSLQGTEIAIEGNVYDISEFVHPGGEIVKFFGGNDVSVQYRMIHPHHTDDQFLSKLKKVRKVSFNPHYKFNTPFEQEMKQEVFKIVKRGKEYATRMFFVRAAFYILLYLTCAYYWTFHGSSTILAIIFGISQAFIGLNVQHDANHGAMSKKYPIINDIFGFGADIIGGSKYTWIEQHWTHHAYTNHIDMDPDSFSAEPIMLFNDYPLGHPARRWYHKFQAIFFLPVLSFYWVSSIFNPQIIDLNHAGTKDIMNWSNAYIRSCRASGWVLRTIYVLAFVGSPFLFHDWATAVYHIWVFSTVESLMLSTLFSLSHNFEEVNRDPTKDYRESSEPICWAKSQVETSSSYGGFVASWLSGGLNFQIEHHLFPRMSSSWYPYIAPTVRRVCEKHNVKYVYYPWIFQNAIATVLYMHRSGNASHWLQNPY